jgi:hypothetical protein
MMTFACVGERFCTSMMRGLRKFVAVLCISGVPRPDALEEQAPASFDSDYFE